MSEVRFTLSVCGIAELVTYKHKDITHLLSVDRPGHPTRTPNWFTGEHMHVFFDDVDSEAEAQAYGSTVPTLEEVGKALTFGQQCLDASRNERVHLLIHCTQGASRSPALAYAILTMHMGEGQEDAALKQLIRIRPYAFPNRLVVDLADQWLKRNGALIAGLSSLWNMADEYRPKLMVKKPAKRKKGSEPPGD